MFTNLRQAGVGVFAFDYHWSSSEKLGSVAWYQLFTNGAPDGNSKANGYRVRPVRGF